jgi:hypothetical protein
LHILGKILRLFSLEKPLQFFGIIARGCCAIASLLFVPVLLEYIETGLVPKFPSLIVAVGGYLLVLPVVGVITATSTGRLEAKRFAYLNVRP